MKCRIITTDAAKSIKTIIQCVKTQKDPQGNDINTWDVKKNQTNEELLVHTPDQWENVGCLSLTPNDENDTIMVKFHYWSNYRKDDRNGDEDKYLLGRFTELMLVHFEGQYTSIKIE